MTSTTAIPDHAPPPTGVRRLVRPLGFLLWGVVLAFSAYTYATDQTITNLVLLCVFILLCIAINAESRIRTFAQKRAWHHETMRLDNSFYIADSSDLPNRTYLLSEVRREIARSAISNVPFTLIHLSLHDFEAIRERRGDEFAELALKAIENLVRRVTRPTDFLSHLGDSNFVIMLVDGGKADATSFLRSSIPGGLSVSNGSNMFDIPIVAQMLEYDMNSVYSADILSQLQEASPLMRDQRGMSDPA